MDDFLLVSDVVRIKEWPHGADVTRRKLRNGSIRGINVNGKLWLIPKVEVDRLKGASDAKE